MIGFSVDVSTFQENFPANMNVQIFERVPEVANKHASALVGSGLYFSVSVMAVAPSADQDSGHLCPAHAASQPIMSVMMFHID